MVDDHTLILDHDPIHHELKDPLLDGKRGMVQPGTYARAKRLDAFHQA
jgi:hypothetical protein